MQESKATDNNATISPDGLWAWDGTSWVPNTNPAPTGSTGAAPATTPTSEKPKKKHTGLKITAGVIAALVVVGMAVSAGGESTPDASESAVEQAAPAAEAAPVSDNAPGIGDPVSDGKFEFTVTNVESGVEQVGDEYLNAQAQGSYTLVTLTVTNTGDAPQTFFTDNLEGTDSQGRELAADSEASYYATQDTDAWLSEINPGNSITVTVVFDVADGETLQSITVHDSAFSGGEEIVLK